MSPAASLLRTSPIFDAGRNEALSFFCASLSLPAPEPNRPPMNSQPTSARMAHTRGRRKIARMGARLGAHVQRCPVTRRATLIE